MSFQEHYLPKKLLPQHALVTVDIPGFKEPVWGRVVGIASTGAPVIGATYIIQPEDPSQVLSDHYPWTHFVAFDSMITRMD